MDLAKRQLLKSPSLPAVVSERHGWVIGLHVALPDGAYEVIQLLIVDAAARGLDLQRRIGAREKVLHSGWGHAQFSGDALVVVMSVRRRRVSTLSSRKPVSNAVALISLCSGVM